MVLEKLRKQITIHSSWAHFIRSDGGGKDNFDFMQCYASNLMKFQGDFYDEKLNMGFSCDLKVFDFYFNYLKDK